MLSILQSPIQGKIWGDVWQAQIRLKESGVEWLQEAICIAMGWCLTPQRAGCSSVSRWHWWPRASTALSVGFPGGADGQEPACQHRRRESCWFNLWVRTIPWSRKWKPTPVSLPGESHGQRSLAGYSSWGPRESGRLMHTHAHTICAQSCPTPVASCGLMDCSPPGFSVHGVFQARILEWVAISYSRGSSQSKDRTRSALQVDSLPSKLP